MRWFPKIISLKLSNWISGIMRPLFGKFLSLFTELKISSTHFSAAVGLSKTMYSAISLP